jgi:hypothetical protein
MNLDRWKLIAGGAALVGVTAGGIVGAGAGDDGPELKDRRAAIEVVDDRNDAGQPGDGSPESVDSPNASVQESAESPFDSPGDPGWADPSPESADSPNESPGDSAESPFDSPGDPGWADPSPETADSPNDSAEDSPVAAPSAPLAPAGDDSPDGGGGGVPVDSPDDAGSDG